MTSATKTLMLRCCECSNTIDESAAFAFGGAFACERCVRNYYRKRPAEVELELRERRREAVRMLKYEREKREKLAAKKTASDKKTALIAAELQDLPLLCVDCKAKISVSTAFEFGGSVACEKCVRDYYRNRPDEVELELQLRRRNAVGWVKRNRKTLEKQAAKRVVR